MTKQRKAQALTITILVAAMGIVVARQGLFRGVDLAGLAAKTAPKGDPAPQDVIYGMLDAAREGNVRGYLDAHTGQMEQALRKAVAEQTEAAFAKYLRETNAEIKGIALQDPQTLTDREVKVRVEYVYADRNEVQQMYLEKSGNTWKVARVDAAERIRTLVPYGTPVR